MAKDEKDIIADNTKLTTDLGTANARIATLEAQSLTLREERDTARAALTKANEMLAASDAKVSTLTAENAGLRAKATDVETAVAAKVIELGLNPKAVSQPKPGAAVMPTGPAAGGAGQPGAQGQAQGAQAQVNYTELCQAHIETHGATQITTDKPTSPK